MRIIQNFSNYAFFLMTENSLFAINSQQKKILAIMSIAFAALAACYLVSRCLKFRAQEEETKPRASEKGEVEEVNPFNPPIEQEAQSEEKNLDEVTIDAPITLPFIGSDEVDAKEEKEEEVAIGSIPLTDTSPLDQEEEDKPKKSLLESAKALEFHADNMLEIIDGFAQEKGETLSEGDKESLLRIKDQQIRLKDIAQQAIKQEQKEISQLQKQIDERKEKIEKFVQQKENLSRGTEELKKQIDKKKEKIEKLVQQKKDLSRGTEEIVLKEISFAPDDSLTGSRGERVKASQYIGKQHHVVDIDSMYTLITEDEATSGRMPNKNESLAILTGTRYEFLSKKYSGGHKIKLFFSTSWEGDGVLPQIKVTGLMLKADVNSAAIINIDAEINMIEEDIKILEKDLPSELELQKWYEDNLDALSKSLAKEELQLKKMDG